MSAGLRGLLKGRSWTTEIDGLAPGRYRVQAFLGSRPGPAAEVELTGSAPATLDLGLDNARP